MEKKGTESVVKRTNAREVTLTAEALVVCKRVKKRKGGGGGRERANTGAAAGKKGREGGGDNDDDDDDDDDAEADEDAPGGGERLFAPLLWTRNLIAAVPFQSGVSLLTLSCFSPGPGGQAV